MTRVFRDLAALPGDARGAVVALGNFDGVHRGHAHLLRAAHAARPDAKLAVLTFSPHPREMFRPDDPPFRLTTDADRAGLLGALGVSLIYQQPFDTAFSEVTAGAFIEDVLHRQLGAAHVACGPDFAFGHRRGGDTALLARTAERLGIGVTIVPPLSDASGVISSTRIRRALQDAYPERAAELLGRAFTVTGPVQHGDARGRTIGFPTANVPLGALIEPARGVYAVTVTLPDGERVRGVANLGRRPTVHDTTESRLEAHLFDWAGDLYGATVRVALRHFLRAERKFASFPDLRAQIERDAAEARAWLDADASRTDDAQNPG